MVLAYIQKHRSLGQNREPREPIPFSQLIFDRGSKHIQWTKDSLLNKWCWENWTDTFKKIEITSSIFSDHKGLKVETNLKEKNKNIHTHGD